MNLKATVAASLAALLVTIGSAQTTKPRDWFLAGSAPSSYDYFTEGNNVAQGRLLVLKSKAMDSALDAAHSFGTVMQEFSANDYRGKRIRLAAELKSNDIDGWAGLWMRVNGLDDKMTAFDNMSTDNRAIKGTTEFKRYEVVLDVTEDANLISIGVLLHGHGQVAVGKLEIDVVSKFVPVTNIYQDNPVKARPTNLNFGS